MYEFLFGIMVLENHDSLHLHLFFRVVYMPLLGVEQISQTGARGFVFVYVQAGHVHGPSAA